MSFGLYDNERAFFPSGMPLFDPYLNVQDTCTHFIARELSWFVKYTEIFTNKFPINLPLTFESVLKGKLSFI